MTSEVFHYTELLTDEERKDNDRLVEELKQEQSKLTRHYEQKEVLSEDELNKVRQSVDRIGGLIDTYVSIALSRLSAETNYRHDFNEDFAEAVFTAAEKDISLSQQFAIAVSEHYCEQYPYMLDLYKIKEIEQIKVDHETGIVTKEKRTETLSEYVKRIAAELEKLTPEELEKLISKNSKGNITTAVRAKNTELLLDSVNSVAWDHFMITPERQLGIMTLGAGSKNGKTATVSYSIDFDGLKDVSISKKLTAFDKGVYMSAAALFKAGNTTMTLTQIAYAMGYQNNPTQALLEKIRKSIIKMNAAQITIDNAAEVKIYKKYLRFNYIGSLLPMEMLRATINGKTTESAIHLFKEPPLVNYARQHNQITTISIKLLQSPVNKTESTIGIELYLLEQIAHMKHPNSKIKNRMLFDTIYKRTGITTAKQKQRAVEKIERLLNHYIEEGHIKNFVMDKSGIDIYW